MFKTIYVGNLPFGASRDEVMTLFAQYGAVNSLKLVSDRETGKFRGFGFVEMEPQEADAAIAALNGNDFGGRTLRVNQARTRKPRSPRQDEEDDY